MELSAAKKERDFYLKTVEQSHAQKGFEQRLKVCDFILFGNCVLVIVVD